MIIESSHGSMYYHCRAPAIYMIYGVQVVQLHLDMQLDKPAFAGVWRRGCAGAHLTHTHQRGLPNRHHGLERITTE